MANFNKINVDGIPYGVEDTIARNSVTAEESARKQADTQLCQQIALQGQQITQQGETIQHIEKALSELEKKPYVYVDDFGAVGDANFYDYQTMSWWTDSSKTKTPTDDGEAIQKAIDYALENNIPVVRFKNKHYYTVGRKYTIDYSKIAILGEAEAQIISTGITSGSFISITSPNTLDQYDYPTVPISNISIAGNYFKNTTDFTPNAPTGISWGTYDGKEYSVVSPHSALFNIVVRGFNIGIGLYSAYKSTMFNVSVIACDTGLDVEGNINPATPWYGYFMVFECCANAVYSGGYYYDSLHFIGGCFEYNRINFRGYGCNYFVGTRFEGDLRACCDNEGNPMYWFLLSDGWNAQLHFTACSFYCLNQYEANTEYWIRNARTITNYNQYLVFSYAPNSKNNKKIIASDVHIYTDETVQFFYGGNERVEIKGMSTTDAQTGGKVNNIFPSASDNLFTTTAQQQASSDGAVYFAVAPNSVEILIAINTDTEQDITATALAVLPGDGNNHPTTLQTVHVTPGTPTYIKTLVPVGANIVQLKGNANTNFAGTIAQIM